ncbi:glycosyltransferase family 5 protein [Lepidopterella palustris CBS 459.81]|uniref:alpha-1,3-glucan synthase n=1 Tax=Lepidopterella palustris CBS 459.81 TaxID=1314670 RepID=A0A8E2EI54_9PEZI|nr:glycosyltransferase family 5 protein [Lepidopterella palustris CBS 459.81]
MTRPIFCLLALLVASVAALRYDPQYVDFNLNQKQDAVNPLDYWGEWENHTFQPSPSNWRFPFYTLFLDRFVNADPTNDDANGTFFEQDLLSTQLRHGGDILGVMDSLDYLQGMGIKAIYIAGSPFINQPWQADSYSPTDFSLLDPHFGTIENWRTVIDEIHKRGMYVVLDNTMSTMSDLIGFSGYLNTTTPFTLNEHKAEWKFDRRYLDFSFSNTYNETCTYPRFWLETGERVGKDVTEHMVGCYDSEFDQYGDTEAFGVFPDWQRQLSKFASVQDRLREWVPSVREKITRFSCIAINMLDIDGFRFDKATQVTVDAQGDFADGIRQCARKIGKENFFMPGEITGGNTFGSIYLGRGKQPEQYQKDLKTAVFMTNNSDASNFIRDEGKNALDAAAFHYTVYRTLTRFLGMDGNLAAGYDAPTNWVESWNTMVLSNDLINPNTGVFDPRHMFGVSNQDVFRWPSIKNGTERMLLGLFITTLHMPGVPLLSWGEEQGFYILDNTASNYIFGRMPISSALAWQTHGCYRLGSAQYYQMPLEAALNGCNDDTVSWDHRDPAHPVRIILKAMYFMREAYPVLNDGFYLQGLSNLTRQIFYPGSNGVPTETGLWSVMRSVFPDFQDLSHVGKGNQSVWLVYHNDNTTVNYQFDCNDAEKALISVFDSGTTVKNLFYPYDELVLGDSGTKLGINGSTKANGCVSQLEMKAYEFKVYVPKDQHLEPPPMITGFFPGHDFRIPSTVAPGKQESVDIEIHFSKEMDCDKVTASLYFNSTTEDKTIPVLDAKSVNCSTIPALNSSHFVGSIPTIWTWKGTLNQVSNGLHMITVNNATSQDGYFTNSVDHFLLRIGQWDNPVVFPRVANYTRALLHQFPENGSLYISHKAAGADKWRYSLNWQSTWSNWTDYTGGNNTLPEQPWTGTKDQEWDDKHVIVQYWSKLTGSSSVVQHADLNRLTSPARRFPHLFAHGPFNQYGFDSGLTNKLVLDNDGRWKFHFMSEWPDNFQLNKWGMNPDGQPDQTGVFGDVDQDFVLDRLPPNTLAKVTINVTMSPPSPYLAYKLSLDDGSFRFDLIPVGNRWQQLALYVLLWIIPVLTAAAGCWVFMISFYGVKFNEVGVSEKTSFIPMVIQRARDHFKKGRGSMELSTRSRSSSFGNVLPGGGATRRCVIIATMEYDIEDWGIKIKIGGLGVMAQLMGKNLQHQDLIWVVPCVGGVDYPVDQPAEPMTVTILGNPYEVQVQYHILKNITYVLLDAPVFRKQSKSEPYPPRMDDLDSAIYYSAWNACIAETIKRFPVDLYHINDYHGAAAPLYLLPRTIPCCLSLHNAEFQGLWPMRTPKETSEVCEVFNLDQAIVAEYVQFGSVFNLLHAGASYLRVHQKGFGAVGVSKKYGKRSFARYPIFWGLTKVGQLPNPDPSDIAEWDKKLPTDDEIRVDPNFEGARADLRKQAQEWAGLEVNPDAELFVFVGRWSLQKGVDLIADVFPKVLEEHSNVQLICIGPVIDLYGKFAALKLGKLMEKYPTRVYSKPEFTALPPYIFSGAEFALIPSRDEPFGLVAVEFGRKGALGVGARVGGLGQMPGWWYTVESTTTVHLLHQFNMAIKSALAAKKDVRAMMRARSAKQRFPVAQWKEDLEILQTTAIKVHEREAAKGHKNLGRPSSPTPTLMPGRFDSPSGRNTPFESRSRRSSFGSPAPLGYGSEFAQPSTPREGPPAGFGQFDNRPTTPREGPPKGAGPGLKRTLSLGVKSGPGHAAGPATRLRDKGRHVSVASTIASVSEYDTDDEDNITGRFVDEYTLTEEEMEQTRRFREGANYVPPVSGIGGRSLMGQSSPQIPSTPHTPNQRDSLLPPQPFYALGQGNASTLSVDSVVGERTDFKLQKVDPFFTDSTGEFYEAFSKKLDNLNAKNSETELCIEDYLIKSEKAWFDKFRDARLGKLGSSSPAPSIYRMNRDSSPPSGEEVKDIFSNEEDEFLLGKDYKPPTGLKKWLQVKIGDWPAYSFLLAFGQIIAANSYQITLLTGAIGESAEKLYIVASIYLVTSIMWWMIFRTLKSIYVLSLPFLFYGIAFLLIGLAPLLKSESGTGWIQNVATGFYAMASSSGSIYFALNFGDEGGSPVKDWVYRACIIQGTQQIYVVALWYWGSKLTIATANGVVTRNYAITSTWKMTAISGPIAVVMWIIGIILFVGLPDFYRQGPGAVPSFYKSLARRKIISWFFVAIIIQNYFLSAPYGRNWAYLWSSRHAPAWAVFCLIVLFFVFLWAALLWIFAKLSKSHSWILPIFAIGLGAPRWCQMLWGTSGIGLFIPWAGGPVSSALLGRAVWLWLGLLDTVQGVGFGMILLQTLTRIHVAFTLIAAQVLGSIATILARATAPDKIGPGDVFPDFSAGVAQGLMKPWFWVALILQIVICVGFFTFFRKEQLSKP